MQTMRLYMLAALTLPLLMVRAEAQQGPYKLQEINFDMWCQEERRLPPERCDKRLPQDDAEYQAYVAKIETYEVPYLQRQRDEENIDRAIIHHDPIDHPGQPSAPQINQVTPPPPTQ